MFSRNNEKTSVNTSATAELRKTALNSIHRRLGAKMVNFGGWDMPVEFSGITAEHLAVRNGVGLFDVSHMGEIQFRGPGALAACSNRATHSAGLSTVILSARNTASNCARSSSA